uniref:ATP synthase F0 subunit 8 n=1 Tax=Triplax ainonia TaxID=2911889 RepID=UPI0022378B99|nr:ATP synthase F0 subunit 8 [Triplax ainonia]UYG49576.1 ATP synthase F0 subunit 8 [Triplax ainonia]
MPQMAPMNWLALFIYFIVIFMMVNSLVYFSFLYKPKQGKSHKNLLKINWKW